MDDGIGGEIRQKQVGVARSRRSHRGHAEERTPSGLGDLIGGEHLASQAQDEKSGDVRVCSVPAERAQQNTAAFTVRHQPAPRLVGERDYSVHVRVFRLQS